MNCQGATKQNNHFYFTVKYNKMVMTETTDKLTYLHVHAPQTHLLKTLTVRVNGKYQYRQFQREHISV